MGETYLAVGTSTSKFLALVVAEIARANKVVDTQTIDNRPPFTETCTKTNVGLDRQIGPVGWQQGAFPKRVFKLKSRLEVCVLFLCERRYSSIVDICYPFTPGYVPGRSGKPKDHWATRACSIKGVLPSPLPPLKGAAKRKRGSQKKGTSSVKKLLKKLK